MKNETSNINSKKNREQKKMKIIGKKQAIIYWVLALLSVLLVIYVYSISS